MSKRFLSILLITAALPVYAHSQSPEGEPGTTITNPGTPSAPTTNTTPSDGSAPDVQSGGQGPDGTATTAGPFVTVPETGAWRVSDFEGKQVYGTDGESIGSIGDVLVSQDGSINAVIIGVGGFLGLGKKDVAVNMSALELGPGATQEEADAASAANPEVAPGGPSGDATAPTAPTPQASDTTNNTAPSGAVAPVAGSEQTSTVSTEGTIKIGPDGLPERIVLNVTRKDLEDAPAFEGLRSETQQ